MAVDGVSQSGRNGSRRNRSRGSQRVVATQFRHSAILPRHTIGAMTGSHPSMCFSTQRRGGEVEIPEVGAGPAVYGGLVAGALRHAPRGLRPKPDALRRRHLLLAPTEDPARLETVSCAVARRPRKRKSNCNAIRATGERCARCSCRHGAGGASTAPAPPRHTIPDPDPLMVVPVVPDRRSFAKVQLRPAHGRFPSPAARLATWPASCA